MKKSIILLVCVLAMGAASAQEKEGGFALEVGVGTVHYGNYSPVSVFANDNNDSYGLVAAEHISLGYRDNSGWFMGFTLGYASGNTSFQNLDETFWDINAMFDIRDYFKLSSRFELEAGVALGLLVHNNQFEYANKDYSFTRYGFSGNFSLGLNYMLNGGSYIGLKAMFPRFGYLTGDKPDLPTGLVATEKTQTISYSLQLSYGIRF